MMIRIVDYGVGNIQAFVNMFQRLDVHVARAQAPGDLADATGLILPGVGAFDHAMTLFNRSGMRERLEERVLGEKVPVLGVCVGMQMILDRSEEGPTEGLGLIHGEVLRFQLEGRLQPDGSRYKVPQMGWNRVWQSQPHAMWAGVPDGSYFYFVHSYYARPSDARHSVGEADYGGRFTAAIARDNIFATQFHPEKSADQGLSLYRNFLSWKP